MTRFMASLYLSTNNMKLRIADYCDKHEKELGVAAYLWLAAIIPIFALNFWMWGKGLGFFAGITFYFASISFLFLVSFLIAKHIIVPAWRRFRSSIEGDIITLKAEKKKKLAVSTHPHLEDVGGDTTVELSDLLMHDASSS